MNRTMMLVTLAVAGCGNSGDPSEDEYNDVAQAIAATTATSNGGGDVGSMADSAALASGQMPLGLTLQSNGHVSGDHFGVDYDYQIACLDEAGHTQSVCDAATDEANVTVSWSGSLDVPNLSASVDRTGNWTLGNIQSGTAQFDGEGTFTFDISVTSIFRPVTSTYHLDYDARYSAVLIDSAYRPIGGSIRYTISAEHTVTGTRGTGDGTFDMVADVRFNSNGTAAITIDGSHHYTVTLATGAVAKN